MIGYVFQNPDVRAGQTIVRPSGRHVYIWKECRIVKESGKIQGTNIKTYEAVDDKGHYFTLDDDDLQELQKQNEHTKMVIAAM